MEDKENVHSRVSTYILFKSVGEILITAIANVCQSPRWITVTDSRERIFTCCLDNNFAVVVLVGTTSVLRNNKHQMCGQPILHRRVLLRTTTLAATVQSLSLSHIHTHAQKHTFNHTNTQLRTTTQVPKHGPQS